MTHVLLLATLATAPVSEPPQYAEVTHSRVTGYTAYHDCEPWCDGRTADLTPADPARRIAACPPRFPFGTKVRVVGLGDFVCHDRGASITGNRVDILVYSKGEAYSLTGWYIVAWRVP